MSQHMPPLIATRLRDLQGLRLRPGRHDLGGAAADAGRGELVDDLRASRLAVVFASNSSRHASGVLRDRLAELGIDTSPNEMLAALDLAGEEVRRQHGCGAHPGARHR